MKKCFSAICFLLIIAMIVPSLCLPAFAGSGTKEQVEITERIPLLDERGKLTKPGYCKTNMYDYDRSAIKSNPAKIKEWDFYQVSNERYCLQVTMADISLGGAGSVCLFDMETGERYEMFSMSLFTFGRMGMDSDAMTPHSLSRKARNFDLKIDVTPTLRKITFAGKKNGEDYKIDLSISAMPGLETMTMALPFNSKGNQFYLNQKINCMPTSGTVTVGDMTVTFDPSDSFCVLDWGRGVWPFKCSWYWGNGSTYLEDGSLFGFEIGWGFGDMGAATENMLFYNGKAHKIDEIYMTKDEKDWLKPWHFTSSDGRFEMTMTPVYDNYTNARILGIGNICHQVFGKWNGTVKLDDGTTLQIKDMMAFCEFSDNHW